MPARHTPLLPTVLLFPEAANRPARARPADGERCGEILLFMGVRYERPEPGPEAPRPAAAAGRRNRRRS